MANMFAYAGYRKGMISKVEAMLNNLNRQRICWAIQKSQKFKKPYQVHIGCGVIRFEEWVNLDYKKHDATDFVLDVMKGLPFEENSCHLIYHEHFLEHLTTDQADFFLKECYKILMPGGCMRIAMPSLEEVIKKYSSQNWKDQDWLTWPEYQFIETRAEMVNIAMRSWGHQWLYDKEELSRRLVKAGFKDIRDASWGNSDLKELNNREKRKDSFLICEVKK